MILEPRSRSTSTYWNLRRRTRVHKRLPSSFCRKWPDFNVTINFKDFPRWFARYQCDAWCVVAGRVTPDFFSLTRRLQRNSWFAWYAAISIIDMISWVVLTNDFSILYLSSLFRRHTASYYHSKLLKWKKWNRNLVGRLQCPNEHTVMHLTQQIHLLVNICTLNSKLPTFFSR